MIARYTRPGMGKIWTDEYKFRKWLEVELAATETLADAGLVPKAAAQQSVAKPILTSSGFTKSRPKSGMM